MKDIPETVQWLLDFANLGKKPGVLNPQIESVFKLKRTPKAPPELSKLNILVFDDYHPLMTRTHNGLQWLVARNKEPLFVGKDYGEFFPKLDEFKQFFLDKGLPPEGKIQVIKGEQLSLRKSIISWELLLKKTGKVSIVTDKGTKIMDSREAGYSVLESKGQASLVIESWRPAILVLNMIREESSKTTEYIKAIFKAYSRFTNRDCIPIKGESFPHNGALPQAVYAHILDFWINYNKLHPRLIQCPCCGRFWIKNTNNKPRVYCSDTCNKVFHKQTREENSKSSSASKKARRDRKKKNDYNAIKEFYVKIGYRIENAESRASEWVYDEGKTLENFKKHECGKG